MDIRGASREAAYRAMRLMEVRRAALVNNTTSSSGYVTHGMSRSVMQMIIKIPREDVSPWAKLMSRRIP